MKPPKVDCIDLFPEVMTILHRHLDVDQKWYASYAQLDWALAVSLHQQSRDSVTMFLFLWKDGKWKLAATWEKDWDECTTESLS